MSRIERDRELAKRRKRIKRLKKLKAKLEQTKDAATRKRIMEQIRKREIYSG